LIKKALEYADDVLVSGFGKLRVRKKGARREKIIDVRQSGLRRRFSR
jgi:nucleoid DNA-binding protein